jgi:ADP-ribose pyrophosphatase
MPPKPWKTISSRPVYHNSWITVREDQAELPNGRTTIYGVVECPGAVGVVPFVADDQVIMVRQYRYVFGENHRWEIPTGGIHQGESLVDAARRELREEIGYDAADLQHFSTFFPSKSVVHEVAHLFIGRDLIQAESIPDETEFLEVAIFPFDRVLQMVVDSEIRDSMSVIAILHTARLRAR